jgi:hypothetical protein
MGPGTTGTACPAQGGSPGLTPSSILVVDN